MEKTKYVILLADGMADRGLVELDGKTPLMIANTPSMDMMASRGTFGYVSTAVEGFPPGSDIMNMNILGYRPERYYTGRAPLEAMSLDIPLEPDDVVFRVNFVTLKPKGKTAVMEDYAAGHISTDHAGEIIRLFQSELGDGARSFYAGKSYRHLMVWHDGPDDLELVPPHDIMGKEISAYIPREPKLVQLLQRAMELLREHPVNQLRVARGQRPANSIWFWGQGKKSNLPLFKERWGLTGAVVCAVDLIKGLGKSAGLEVSDVPGATGYYDTNYEGKVKFALDALEEKDFVFLHVEAPDEAGHNAEIEFKIEAIENFDARVVEPVLKGMEKFSSWRVLVMPDHATPIEVRTHVKDAVPFAILTSEDPLEPRRERKFEENVEGEVLGSKEYIGEIGNLHRLFFGKE
mgnify:CR=1 FL=1